MFDDQIKKAFNDVRLEPGAEQRIRQKIEAELDRSPTAIDDRIKPAYKAVCLQPGAEERIQQNLEEELGRSLDDCSVTVKPRRNPLPKILAAAAMLAIVIGGSVLILWPLIRQTYERIHEPLPLSAAEAPPPVPAAEPEPGETEPIQVLETPEAPEEPEPTPEPWQLGAIVDEGTVTAENGNTLSWAVDENGLLLISGSGKMDDFLGNYGWQTSSSDQYPWTGYLTSVRTVIVEPGLSSIGERAFLDFRYLTKAVIPEGVTSIGYRAFHSCTELEELSIPAGMQTIGDYAFYDCKSLKSIPIPAGVTSIGTKAFSHCPLTGVEIPGSVAGIGEYAFEYCQSLRSVKIGEGVQAIGNYAFYLCEDMTVIVIPASVTEIGTGAFVGCGNLAEVYYAGSKEQWEQIAIGSGNDSLLSAEIYYETIPESLSADDLPAYQLGTVVDEGTVTAENGNKLTWTLDENGLLLISGVGDMEDFYPFIGGKHYDPSTGGLVNDSKPAYPWLKYLNSIRTVLIEPGLSSIGDNAFSNAASLIRVQIPETVTRIGTAAFSNCRLESVTIPDGVTSIGEYAFSNCRSLTSISISDSVTSIGEWAFTYTGLESVTIPGSVEIIGDNAFNNCRSLKSVTILDGVREIGGKAFFYCDSLAELSIPGSVTKIGYGAFYWCGSLESVVIPEGVTEIGNECFSNCTALKSVWLPASLSSISYGHFENCVSLSDIYYAGSEEQWDQIMEAFAKGLLARVTIHYEAADETAAQASGEAPDAIADQGSCGENLSWELHADGRLLVWGRGPMDCGSGTPWTGREDAIRSVEIQNGVTTIDAWAFARCGYLTEARISDSVTEIGTGAFSDCGSLKDLTIGEGVTGIGDWAFADCGSLERVTIPGSVKTIGELAFVNCKNLTDLRLSEGLEEIGLEAFAGCYGLTDLTIPESVTEIVKSAFEESGLTSVTIPAGVKWIGEYAFSFCPRLEAFHVAEDNPTYSAVNGVLYNKDQTVLLCVPGGMDVHDFRIPASVKEIDAAFCGCESLTEITIPGTVEIIGPNAFYSCWDLEHVTIEEGTTTIQYVAFAYCQKLTSVSIPASVTSIGESNFHDSESLTDIYYAGTEEQWNQIEIGKYNEKLLEATIHFNSEG